MVVGFTPLGAAHSRLWRVAPGVSTLLVGTTTSIGWPLSKVPGVNGVWAWAALVIVLPDAPGPVPACAVPVRASVATAQTKAAADTAKAFEARRTNTGAAPFGTNWSGRSGQDDLV